MHRVNSPLPHLQTPPPFLLSPNLKMVDVRVHYFELVLDLRSSGFGDHASSDVEGYHSAKAPRVLVMWVRNKDAAFGKIRRSEGVTPYSTSSRSVPSSSTATSSWSSTTLAIPTRKNLFRIRMQKTQVLRNPSTGRSGISQLSTSRSWNRSLNSGRRAQVVM
ncbi:hypothetical protein CPB84DRAFT_1851114 [Gymnopilus junonius]|uniref:Uncharacterized protein n=1 Tax=Gymnopilus junonius TaxID=109634 RepID=A0A9P5THW4_GYMJU|nr:hypothetical protein CPB84DRAFT_1851114 [Gymnopilus junonius]